MSFETLAEWVGIPVDSFKAAVVLIGSYPLALMYSLLPTGRPYSATLRHVFSIFSSTLLFLSLFSLRPFVEIIIMLSITYILCAFGRGNPYVPVIAFVAALGHLSWNLLRIQIFSNETDRFDASAPMMILAIKLSSFAWSCYDGSRPVSELSSVQKDLAIREYPSILEYLGFVFFFPSFLVGPAVEFAEYRSFTRNVGTFANIPPRLVPTLKSVLMAVVAGILYVSLSSVWSFDECAEPQFLKYPLWLRIMFFNAAGFIARTKYYTAWMLSEGACNLTGIGYSGRLVEVAGEPGKKALVAPTEGVKGVDVWDRAKNVEILSVEFGTNPSIVVGNWNKKTAFWLRHYVYLRLTKKGEKPKVSATIMTYLVSAFWHGFYPGYYLTFFFASFYNFAGRTLRRNVRPLVASPNSSLRKFKPIYDVLGWFLTMCTLNFVVAPFHIWKFQRSIEAWNSVYWIPLLGCFAILIAFDLAGLNRVVRRFGRSVGVVYETNVAVNVDGKKKKGD